MEGKEAIIKKILDDAQTKATDIVAEASQTSDNAISQAKEWAKNYTLAEEKRLQRDIKDIFERKLTVAQLDVRKAILGDKQNLINKAFELAREKLCAMPKNDYLAFVSRLIEEHAEDGDAIVLSNDGVLTAKDVEGLPVYKAKSLKISQEKGNFKGGVLLIGKASDKSLTFADIIEGIKEDEVASVADLLF